MEDALYEQREEYVYIESRAIFSDIMEIEINNFS